MVISEPDLPRHTLRLMALFSAHLFPLRFNSLSKVTTCRAPVQPRGCPRAIAPPRGLTFSMGMPSFSTQYTAWKDTGKCFTGCFHLCTSVSSWLSCNTEPGGLHRRLVISTYKERQQTARKIILGRARGFKRFVLKMN